ncbi:MAG: GNAT family N-acetyltransferase [Ilumatobacteraceae bacterium]|nr:GNAT family N-acetyltransferase [Ilumatobacteraceae bacterium]
MVNVRRATELDISRIARTASRAFVDDPVMRWLVPDDEEYERDHRLLFGNIARRWLATDSLWCTDDVAAVAGWIPPGRPEVDPEGIVQVEHPEWRLARFAALGEAMGANTPPEPHWYLNMLATHPDWQRQGMGGALMRVVFEIADAEGLPCYLETETEVNVAYYRRHGFEVRTEWDVQTDDSEGPHMWGMLRPAR